MRGSRVNTTTAFLIILIISVIVGFILTRNQEPIADTAEYGIEAVDQIRTLNETSNE